MGDKICFDKKLLEQIQNYNIEDVLLFIEKLDEESRNIIRSKDKDYGGSWQQDGILSVHLNTKRKWDRLQNMFENGFQTPENESIMDTLLDLRNYLSLYIYFISDKLQ
jgi:hypothetical protein